MVYLKRNTLEQVERQIGHTPPELQGPEFPRLVANVWSAFISLSNSRTAGFSGPNPITYEQIKAWKELTETPVSAREIGAIMSVDVVYMRVANG